MRALLAGVETEVSVSFSVSGASEEEDSLAVGSQLGELVEGVGGSLGLVDSVFGSLGEFEGADSESFGDVDESGVVGDVADDGDDSVVELGFALRDLGVVGGEVLDNPGDGDREAGQTGLVKSFVDDFIELSVGSAGHEGVELNVMAFTLMSDCR